MSIDENINKGVIFAQLGDPILRQQAVKIDNIQSNGTKKIIKMMMAALLNSKGVGLAAPQMFESVRIVIIASKPSKRYPLAPEMSPVVMINPSFEPLSKNIHKDWEGCLSIPSVRAMVPRYRQIKISFYDQKGEAQELITEDFIARVFQHEYDHLNGLVYLDRVEDNKDIISELEFQKLMAMHDL